MAELTNETTELLAQAIRAIQYGHKSTAASYLNRILDQDPENMDAWRWLAECMPNQAKRQYCLDRAGIPSANSIPTRESVSRSSFGYANDSSINQSPTLSETTVAERHAHKVEVQGKRRAELPPSTNFTEKEILNSPVQQVELKKARQTKPQKPNPPRILARKPLKQKKGKLNGRILLFSMGVICFTVLSGYILFSTGLTTYKSVLKWVNTQIENNAEYLPGFEQNPSPTPLSLFDQPAENPDVLATYFPTPVSTLLPEEIMPAPVAISSEGSSRESAEIPSPESTEIAPIENVDSSPSIETVPQPNGFVDGPTIIGKSVKGNNLDVMQFGNGPVERMMVAGIHGGNEWNTTALADELIEYLKKNPQVIPADRTLYILRLLNPDGEERGHNVDGRTNERGVDLNRNWDAFWVENWPRDGCWNYRPISAGSGPFSEPETAALRDFIEARNISALVNYHSAALGVFAGGRPPEAESIRLAQSISAVTNYAYPPMDTGCKYTGQFADWLAMNGTAAVDLELTNHTDTDFDANLKVLDVLLKWEPSTGPKSLTGLINLAETTPVQPTFSRQISKFGALVWNEVNAVIFGRQEEK